MTVKLRPDTEQALIEAVEMLSDGLRLEVPSGFRGECNVREDPGGTANELLLIMCSAIIRDGHIKWPLVVEQRHETPEETAARLITQDVPENVAGDAV